MSADAAKATTRSLLFGDQLLSKDRPRSTGALFEGPAHIVVGSPAQCAASFLGVEALSDFNASCTPYPQQEISRTFDVRRLFSWVVDLDERGVFKAHVEDASGREVFSCDNEDKDFPGVLWLVEFGFMRNAEDLNGLTEYLREIGVIQPLDRVIRGSAFDAYVDSLRDSGGHREPFHRLVA